MSLDIAKVEAAPRVVDDVSECDFYHSMDIPGHGAVEGQWDLRNTLGAYLGGFALWWAGWLFGVVLTAAAMRALIEAGTFAAVLVWPSRALDARLWLERLGLAVLYLGMPGWLAYRALAG